jgi:hypothetical protein
MYSQIEKLTPEEARIIKKNPFFKNFTHQYNKNINESLEKHFGRNFSQKSKSLEGTAYD